MTFADTSNIKLNVLLSSVRVTENFIRQFVEAHNKDKSSFTPDIKVRLAKSDIKIQLVGLTMLYQQKIIPEMENELRKSATKEVEAEWRKKGKEPYYKREIGTTGKYIREMVAGFSPEVTKRIEQKKKNNKNYWRRTQEQTRIGSASNIINGGGVESDVPSGFEMDDDGSSQPNPPPPPNNPQEKKCESCSKSIEGKGKYCKKCFKQWFVENRLKNLRGWDKLSSEVQEHYLSQIDKCDKGADFKTLKQMVLDTISKMTFTCSECNKNFSGKRWGIKGIEDKIFCSEDCSINWQKKNQKTDPEQEEKNSNGNEKGGTGEEGEEDDFDDNFVPNSDGKSENTPAKTNQNGQINNNLPEDIQAIANLPLLQAQTKAEEKIEKLLKDNGLSNQELGRKSNWKDYLKKLNNSTQVAEFTNEMKQIILQKSLTKWNLNQEPKPKNDWVLPAIILSVLAFSALTLIIVVHKRRQRNK